jgi:uncharacterized membrane protein YvlD (DUF360 family)
MIRLIVRTAVMLVANAVGLIVAAALLDGVTLDAAGFIVAVIVFTLAMALMQPFLAVQLRRGGSAALGGVARIASLAALIITVILTDGLTIDGAGTWIAAAVIVWVAAMIAAFILPFLGLKKYLEQRSA